MLATEHENQSSQLTQSDHIPDSLMLHSPEKSIEQAVNAALCSLERDMENTEEEDDELSSDDMIESSVTLKSTSKPGNDNMENVNASASPTGVSLFTRYKVPQTYFILFLVEKVFSFCVVQL